MFRIETCVARIMALEGVGTEVVARFPDESTNAVVVGTSRWL